jgi:hypothetical protein
VKGSELGKCWRESVGYSLVCQLCQDDDIKAIYSGETGRSANQRGVEHENAMEDMELDHPMVKHAINNHPEEAEKENGENEEIRI